MAAHFGQNLVVTDGNTLLAPEEVEMLSVLRMNRGFMETSRSKHSHEAKPARGPFTRGPYFARRLNERLSSSGSLLRIACIFVSGVRQ